MNNIPKVKVGIVAVSRDCFPESLSVNRRKALTEAYAAKYDAENIYELLRLYDEIDLENYLISKGAEAEKLKKLKGYMLV